MKNIYHGKDEYGEYACFYLCINGKDRKDKENWKCIKVDKNKINLIFPKTTWKHTRYWRLNKSLSVYSYEGVEKNLWVRDNIKYCILQAFVLSKTKKRSIDVDFKNGNKLDFRVNNLILKDL